MKKKYIQLAILVLLLAVAVIAFILLKKAPDNEAVESSAEEIIYAFGGEGAPAPASIKVSRGGDWYIIVNAAVGQENAEPTIQGWEKLSLDSYTLGNAIKNAQALPAKRLLLENPSSEDLISFGLLKPTTPTTYVTITGADGGVTALSFGYDAPGGEGIYALCNDKIYLVASSAAEPFMKPKAAYVNKAVTATDPDFKGFDKIVLSGGNYPEPIIIERTPETEFSAGGQSFNTHSITSPVKSGVDSNNGLTSLNSVYGLIATDVYAVADDGETLEKYGLSEPAAVISVTGSADNPGMTFELRVSKTDSDGNVALIKSGSPVIYKLAASSLPWLDLKLFDYMDKMIVFPNIDTISSVKLILSDESYEFDLTGEGDTLAVTVNGSALDIKNFKQYYQTVIFARYEEEVPVDFVLPNTSPIAQIEYHYKSGKATDVVKFYTGPTRRVAITLNDGKPYLCSSTYFDRLLEDAVKVSADETVKSYL